MLWLKHLRLPIRLSECASAIQRVFRKYRDGEVDLADASLVHLATELRTGDILTLDRDFAVYLPLCIDAAVTATQPEDPAPGARYPPEG